MTTEEYVPTSVLFTGGAGFIGSNVLLHLIETFPDCTFVCLDKLDYCATVNNFQEQANNPKFSFVKGDICNADLVKLIMRQHKIDTVLHFAAQTHVDNSFGNSILFTESNILGTHNLLECTRVFGDQIKRFIHVSTDEVYGENVLEEEKAKEAANDEETGFHEQSALNPTNPYAATKAAAEFLVKAYRTSFKLPTIITRGNNVYGPRQYPEKLIPKFISLLQQGRQCPIHGDGTHRRSYLYVSDVARAFELIVRKGQLGQIYNVGTDYEIANLETARHLLKAFGLEKEEEKYIVHVEDRHFNDRRYKIDNTKLAELGWKPLVDFEEGLKLTAEWYAAHPNHWPDVSRALVAHPRNGWQPDQ